MTVLAYSALGLATIVTALIVAIFLEMLKKWVATAIFTAIDYVKKRVTVSITFTWKDPAYEFIKEWLKDHPYAKRARNVRIVFDEKNKTFRPIPAPGLHWMWYKGPLWIRYGAPAKTVTDSVTEAVEQAFSMPVPHADKDDYTVTMLTLDHRKIQRFMEEIAAKTINQDKKKDHIQVYTWLDGYWSRGYPKRKRPLDKVYMPEDQKRLVVASIDDFLKSEEKYLTWGIPYRYGIQLDGITGTGKTTLATALAGHFDKPVYCINLNSFSNDNALMLAFRYIDFDGIPLIEDIDAFKCTQARAGVAHEDGEVKSDAAPSTPGKDGKVDGVTLSGLLNAIDGLGATEGRILIITTNDPKKLDPALVRAARIDLQMTIGPLGPNEVAIMVKNFFPSLTEGEVAEVKRLAAARPPQTAAVWQKAFITHNADFKALVRELASTSAYRG